MLNPRFSVDGDEDKRPLSEFPSNFLASFCNFFAPFELNVAAIVAVTIFCNSHHHDFPMDSLLGTTVMATGDRKEREEKGFGCEGNFGIRICGMRVKWEIQKNIYAIIFNLFKTC